MNHAVAMSVFFFSVPRNENNFALKCIFEPLYHPFGYKLTDAELAILNIFALDRDDFDKYRLKGFKGTSNRNSIYRREGDQLVVDERNFTADGYIVDNKDNKLKFGSKIKSKVLSVESGVKPYSAAQLKGGKVQYLDTPKY